MTTLPEPHRCALARCGKELQPGEVFMDSRGDLYCSAQHALEARGILRKTD